MTARTSYTVPIPERLLPDTEAIAAEYQCGATMRDLATKWQASTNVIGAILALEHVPARRGVESQLAWTRRTRVYRRPGACEGQRQHCGEMGRECVYRPEEGHCPACRDRMSVEIVAGRRGSSMGDVGDLGGRSGAW